MATKVGKILLYADAAFKLTHRRVLLALNTQRSTLYSDRLFAALSEAARRALRDMNLPKYEYKTEFAKRYYGQGLSEGKAEGRTEGRAAADRRLTG